MPVTNGTLRLQYDERVHDGMRLGRNLELDARSLRYTVAEARRIVPAEHVTPIPIMDQSSLGSCTGNAGTYHLAALYGINFATVRLLMYTLSSDAINNEKFAIELYHEATILDGFPGAYPPEDTGSSGLGICRALKQRHLITGYSWALSTRGVASMLQHGGAIMGMPWLEAFFEPGQNGFIDANPRWADSEVAGGHEVYIEALESWSDTYPDQSVIRLCNSWGTSWGDHGRFRMRLGTYNLLRQQVDVKQFSR
jgi:hypothetical protein